MIYLITVEGQNYCKIGFTSNVEKRLNVIQTSNPFKCTVKYTIIGDKCRESFLHEKFKEYRLNGEWFLHNEEIESYFNSNYNDTRPLYKMVLNAEEALKQNIFMGFDRVGQFNLMLYIGVKLDLETMTWKFRESCLKDNKITLSTFNNYIKVLVKHNIVEKKSSGIYGVNKNLFIYKPINYNQ